MTLYNILNSKPNFQSSFQILFPPLFAFVWKSKFPFQKFLQNQTNIYKSRKLYNWNREMKLFLLIWVLLEFGWFLVVAFIQWRLGFEESTNLKHLIREFGCVFGLREERGVFCDFWGVLGFELRSRVPVAACGTWNTHSRGRVRVWRLWYGVNES